MTQVNLRDKVLCPPCICGETIGEGASKMSGQKDYHVEVVFGSDRRRNRLSGKQCEASTFSFGTRHPQAAVGGYASKAQDGDFTFSKKMDRLSLMLQDEASNGVGIDDVTVRLVKQTPRGKQPIVIYTFKGVTITGYQIGADYTEVVAFMYDDSSFKYFDAR